MAFTRIVVAIALLAAAPVSASAQSVRFAFSGTVTFATPEIFAALGVIPGVTIEGYYEFDPSTPRDPQSPTAFYREPFTARRTSHPPRAGQRRAHRRRARLPTAAR